MGSSRSLVVGCWRWSGVQLRWKVLDTNTRNGSEGEASPRMFCAILGGVDIWPMGHDSQARLAK